MTDGILLAEMAQDRDLLRYDTLIIDEAHERSLNIDFILGYLRQLLPRRPDLKVVITSATIDPERFAAHFSGKDAAPAPIVEVSGRTYPVEVRYRPLYDDDEEDASSADENADPNRDQVQAISDAIDELLAEPPGDILVFLSGEREIRDTAEALKGSPGLDILPLYARLSSAEQHRVFELPAQRSKMSRRVVLATNVAETSLTVPGIRYVIDPGTARISRYSHRTKVQRLPIERVSQASANQRKGRCGRVADGICIRLYSEEDFEGRPEFTDPEILRTNLASVILQMAAARLGDVREFPFIDPPDPRAIDDGVRLLEELNAFAGGRLTETGRQLARLPVDPRIARMIIEAGRNGCAREVLIIAAALSIQDPRERPSEAQAAADAMHRRFAVEDSDFMAFLGLWDYLAGRQRELSGSAFRRQCKAEYLNYLRVREWQDLHGQLQSLAADLGVAVRSSSSERTLIHVALLAGLLSHVGMKIVVAPRAAAGGGGGQWPGPCGRSRSTSARAGPGSRSSPALAWRAGRLTGSSPPSLSRPHGCGAGWPPRSTRSGSSRWLSISCDGPTASPGGRASAARPSPRRRSRCPGSRSSPTGRWPSPRSTRRPRVTCSSGMRWSRATGRRGTTSSGTTSGSSARPPSLSSGRAAAASSSARTYCTTSTTRASRPMSSPRGTSTPGGRRPGTPRLTCSRSPWGPAQRRGGRS